MSGGATNPFRRPAGFLAGGPGWSADSTSTSRSCWSLFSSSDRTRSQRDGSLLRDGQHGSRSTCLARQGTSRSALLLSLSEQIFGLAARFSPSFCLPGFLPGVENVWADAPSRFRGGRQWSGSFARGAFAALCRRWGTPGVEPLRVPPLCPNYRPF
ncbi:hypothetical protein GWK47_043354 [Chionoecetes opilio]|uniref:Uncharacterized protein n=1 Tax=Chionoecetes opilio TaxID=41210 RepID=A0A8J4YAE9_CHIOP|nr:hypothetical protein GWK47_043354 [Chionoecetes opilio]